MKRAPLAASIALALGLLAAVASAHAQSRMPRLGILDGFVSERRPGSHSSTP
jgi:hypothetical protein